MERIIALLPSVSIIACIAGATFLYLKSVAKYFGENFKSVEWLKANNKKVQWMYGAPLMHIYAPLLEELIFRAPLVIAFSTLSKSAWQGVWVSASLFALTHWFGKKILLPEVIDARENGSHQTDDLGAEVDRLHREKGRKRVIALKIAHVITTLPLGILAGYYGIKYQSVWVSVGIHFAWNLVMPIILEIVVMIIYSLYILWDTARVNRRVCRTWR